MTAAVEQATNARLTTFPAGGTGWWSRIAGLNKPSVARSTSDRQTDQRGRNNDQGLRDLPFQPGEPEGSGRDENGRDVDQGLPRQDDHGPGDCSGRSCGDSGDHRCEPGALAISVEVGRRNDREEKRGQKGRPSSYACPGE